LAARFLAARFLAAGFFAADFFAAGFTAASHFDEPPADEEPRAEPPEGVAPPLGRPVSTSHSEALDFFEAPAPRPRLVAELVIRADAIMRRHPLGYAVLTSAHALRSLGKSIEEDRNTHVRGQ
jgi:hypothetical protein